MADLTGLTATELLALYRSGQASPTEATRDVLARIDRLNPVLNAFCHLVIRCENSGKRDSACQQHLCA